MSSLKGIIFDFNGTLLPDTPYHNKAWNVFLNKNFGIVLSDKELHDHIHGINNSDILSYVLKGNMTPALLNDFSQQKEQLYRDLVINDHLALTEGAERVFQNCFGACVPIAIASSADKDNMDFYISEYSLRNYFMLDRIIYNDYSFIGKPAPDIFFKAAHSLNLQPDEIIVFEDSRAGIAAAQNFGAGKIVIINSTGDDYSDFPFLCLPDFNPAVKLIDELIIAPKDKLFVTLTESY